MKKQNTVLALNLLHFFNQYGFMILMEMDSLQDEFIRKKKSALYMESRNWTNSLKMYLLL